MNIRPYSSQLLYSRYLNNKYVNRGAQTASIPSYFESQQEENSKSEFSAAQSAEAAVNWGNQLSNDNISWEAYVLLTRQEPQKREKPMDISDPSSSSDDSNEENKKTEANQPCDHSELFRNAKPESENITKEQWEMIKTLALPKWCNKYLKGSECDLSKLKLGMKYDELNPPSFERHSESDVNAYNKKFHIFFNNELKAQGIKHREELYNDELSEKIHQGVRKRMLKDKEFLRLAQKIGIDI